jgi:biotin operon repressor
MSAKTIGRLVELMKSVRCTPMTRDEIMVGLGWSRNIVWADVRELEAQGVLVRTMNVSPANREVIAFRLAPAWGGQG